MTITTVLHSRAAPSLDLLTTTFLPFTVTLAFFPMGIIVTASAALLSASYVTCACSEAIDKPLKQMCWSCSVASFLPILVIR